MWDSNPEREGATQQHSSSRSAWSEAKGTSSPTALVDAGRIHSTATEVAGKIDAATLRAVHARIESGSARGKIVLTGF